MQKSSTASIFIRIKGADGKRRYVTPVFDNQGIPKSMVSRVDGGETRHPDGVYVVRYQTPEGVRRWKAVGKDPKRAAAARGEIMSQVSRGIDPITTQQFKPILTPGPSSAAAITMSSSLAKPQTSLAAALKKWVFESPTGDERAPSTVKAYARAAEYFLCCCSKSLVADIDKDDVKAFKDWLRAHDQDARTVWNNMTFLRSFFRSQEVTGLIAKKDLPRLEKKVVRAYTDQQLRAMRSVGTPEDTLLLDFLVGTGFREGEVMHACYSDIDWDARIILVQNKPEWKFKVKDRAQRRVAIAEHLLLALAQRKKQRPGDQLIFPTKSGIPDGHLIRVVKRLQFDGGLSCGRCVDGEGNTCATHPICAEFGGLHTCRKSFATLLSEQGMSLQTISDQLGHDSLETTRSYLAVADLTSERTRSQTDAAFARFTSQAT